VRHDAGRGGDRVEERVDPVTRFTTVTGSVPHEAVYAPDVDWARLREKFPPEMIGKLPATGKRPALDFVGHAAVTDRLNRWAPGWSYTVDEVFTHGGDFWIRGTMVIGGIRRVEFGDGANPKEAIGNFIRRAAMRYGVAIDLWSREELAESTSAPGDREVPPSPSAGETATNERGSATGGELRSPPSSPPSTSPPGGDESGAEGRTFGEGADPEPLTTSRPAGPREWAAAQRQLKVNATEARELVLTFLKRAYGIKSLEQIDEDMLREAVAAIQLAKRTVKE
jgi:hypothetical protein